MTTIKRWTLIVLGALIVMVLAYGWLSKGSYASASELKAPDNGELKTRGGCLTIAGHDYGVVKGHKDAAFPPRVTFFTMTQTVHWAWDCHGNFTNGANYNTLSPHYTRSFWQNDCVACQYQFQHWFAPEDTKGLEGGCHWERREQKAAWDLNLAVYTQHKVFGLWQRVGAWALVGGGGGYSEGVIGD